MALTIFFFLLTGNGLHAGLPSVLPRYIDFVGLLAPNSLTVEGMSKSQHSVKLYLK